MNRLGFFSDKGVSARQKETFEVIVDESGTASKESVLGLLQDLFERIVAAPEPNSAMYVRSLCLENLRTLIAQNASSVDELVEKLLAEPFPEKVQTALMLEYLPPRFSKEVFLKFIEKAEANTLYQEDLLASKIDNLAPLSEAKMATRSTLLRLAVDSKAADSLISLFEALREEKDSQIRKMELDLAEKQRNEEGYQREIASYKSHTDVLTSRVSKGEISADDVRTELNRNVQRMKNLEAMLQREKDRREEDLRELRESLEKELAKVQSFERKVSQLELAKRSLEQMNDELNEKFLSKEYSELKEKADRFEQLETQYDRETSEHSALVIQLNERIAAHEKRIGHLIDQIAKLQEHNEWLLSEIARLKSSPLDDNDDMNELQPLSLTESIVGVPDDESVNQAVTSPLSPRLRDSTIGLSVELDALRKKISALMTQATSNEKEVGELTQEKGELKVLLAEMTSKAEKANQGLKRASEEILQLKEQSKKQVIEAERAKEEKAKLMKILDAIEKELSQSKTSNSKLLEQIEYLQKKPTDENENAKLADLFAENENLRKKIQLKDSEINFLTDKCANVQPKDKPEIGLSQELLTSVIKFNKPNDSTVFRSIAFDSIFTPKSTQLATQPSVPALTRSDSRDLTPSKTLKLKLNLTPSKSKDTSPLPKMPTLQSISPGPQLKTLSSLNLSGKPYKQPEIPKAIDNFKSSERTPTKKVLKGKQVAQLDQMFNQLKPSPKPQPQKASYSYDYLDIAHNWEAVKLIDKHQGSESPAGWFSDKIIRVNSHQERKYKRLVVSNRMLFILEESNDVKRIIPFWSIDSVHSKKNENFFIIKIKKSNDPFAKYADHDEVLESFRKNELLLFIIRRANEAGFPLIFREDIDIQAVNSRQIRFKFDHNAIKNTKPSLEKTLYRASLSNDIFVASFADRDVIGRDKTKEKILVFSNIGIICFNRYSFETSEFIPFEGSLLIETSQEGKVVEFHMGATAMRRITFPSETERENFVKKARGLMKRFPLV